MDGARELESAREPFWTPATVPGVIVGVFLVGAVGFLSFMFLTLGYCGGDGGSPYAAPASPRGKFCEGGGQEAALWLPFVGLLGGLVLAYAVRRRGLVIVAILAGVALAIAPNLVAAALPKTCVGDDPAIPNDREYGPDYYDCY